MILLNFQIVIVTFFKKQIDLIIKEEIEVNVESQIVQNEITAQKPVRVFNYQKYRLQKLVNLVSQFSSMIVLESKQFNSVSIQMNLSNIGQHIQSSFNTRRYIYMVEGNLEFKETR